MFQNDHTDKLFNLTYTEMSCKCTLMTLESTVSSQISHRPHVVSVARMKFKGLPVKLSAVHFFKACPKMHLVQQLAHSHMPYIISFVVNELQAHLNTLAASISKARQFELLHTETGQFLMQVKLVKSHLETVLINSIDSTNRSTIVVTSKSRPG